MNHDNTNTETSGGRWLRVSLLTLTMVAPIVNSIMDYFRKRAELDGASTADQVSSRQRLDELTYATRQRAGAQAQQLQNWAQDWSQDLRKRGEDLAEVLLDGGIATLLAELFDPRVSDDDEAARTLTDLHCGAAAMHADGCWSTSQE